MTIASEIHQIITLLTPPEAWCKYSSAVDKNNHSLLPHQPDACSWRLVGAVWKLGISEATVAFLTSRTPQRSLVLFNDSLYTTHADLMDFLRHSVGKAKKTAIAA